VRVLVVLRKSENGSTNIYNYASAIEENGTYHLSVMRWSSARASSRLEPIRLQRRACAFARGAA